jgi:hypothetical protein
MCYDVIRGATCGFRYIIQIAQIANDLIGATTLSLNTEQMASLLVARVYLDSWVRSAGDRGFMNKLISGNAGNSGLTTNRNEDIAALINFYSATGVWCDIKTFVNGGLIVGTEDLLSGNNPKYVSCQPNVDIKLINDTINNAVSEINLHMQTLRDTIGPFAASSSGTFDIPTVPPLAVTEVAPQSTTLNQLTIFTLTGTSLTRGMGFALADCDSVGELSGGSDTQRQFACTPRAPGSKAGVVKDVPGGSVLKNFTVTVANSNNGWCNQTVSFDNNQLPSNWNITLIRGGPGVVNNHLQGTPVDSGAEIGSTAITMKAGVNKIIAHYHSDIEYSYWGMHSGLGFTSSSGKNWIFGMINAGQDGNDNVEFRATSGTGTWASADWGDTVISANRQGGFRYGLHEITLELTDGLATWTVKDRLLVKSSG